MGEFGVGSRGVGDFYVHAKLGEVIGKTGAVVDSSQLDDSGVVKIGENYLVVTIDGIHSRLSDFPFLSGFHVARAALRDVYSMGARPANAFRHSWQMMEMSQKIRPHCRQNNGLGTYRSTPNYGKHTQNWRRHGYR